MPSEDDLRSALRQGVAFIYPDVDADLEQVLGRATRRAVTRRSSYAAGVAAAVALAVLLVGHDWRPAPDEPEPAEPIQVRDLPSGVGRYVAPAKVEPGRYNVDFLPDSWPHRVEAEIDVPAGWGQDDRFALATGPGGRSATRRIDFVAGRDASLTWCAEAGLGLQPTPLEVAGALGPVSAMSASTPEPVTVGGHPGYFVELQDSREHDERLCRTTDTNLYTVPGIVCRGRGFTTLAWVLDVDGRLVSLFASYGPAVTDDQADELVQMVESATITVR